MLHSPSPSLQRVLPRVHRSCAWRRELTLLVGTKEWEECSGRGLCSRETGVCACFSGYGSSDGQNNPGPYEDCGYVLPAVEAMAELAGVVA